MEDMDDSVLMMTKRAALVDEDVSMKSCCEKSLAETGSACCKAANKQTVDSGLSQIILGVVPKMTRHESRFGITSFVYKARRPFHPGR